MNTPADYTCSECGKKQARSSDKSVPECCGKPMEIVEPLPACEMSSTAEHSRMDEDIEPCDDGRAGVVR